MRNKALFLFIDGAARGNPGPAGIGVVVRDKTGRVVKEFNKYLGEATNNVAEYSALIFGLQEVMIQRADEVVINLDSELIVRQLRGEYRVKTESLKPLFDQALHLLGGFKRFEIKHIKREENKAADRLANKAINLAGLSKR